MGCCLRIFGDFLFIVVSPCWGSSVNIGNQIINFWLEVGIVCCVAPEV